MNTHGRAEVGIVGAGPVGVELAAAFKRAGTSVLQWEAGQVGATMQWWPAGTRWFSGNERIAIAGVPLETPLQEKASREEYLAYLRAVVLQFGLVVNTFERVTAAEKAGGGFVVKTVKGPGGAEGVGRERVYQVDHVVLSTGGTEKPRTLGIPGENLPHVSHYFKEPHTYFKQRVLIVGGRNSAVEAAIRCYRVNAEVAVSYRGPGMDEKDIKYWLWPEFNGLTRSGKIAAHFNTVPVEITPEAVRLARADGSTEDVPADFVLMMVGYLADMRLFRQAGVELTSDREVPTFNRETMETNVPGLYVAGTAVAGTQGRYRIFLENCHAHVGKIVAAVTGKKDATSTEVVWERAES